MFEARRGMRKAQSGQPKKTAGGRNSDSLNVINSPFFLKKPSRAELVHSPAIRRVQFTSFLMLVLTTWAYVFGSIL